MLKPTKLLPQVGSRARILHFGGDYEQAVVTAVHDDGRRLEVRGEGGESFAFELNAATARFIAAGSGQAPACSCSPIRDAGPSGDLDVGEVLGAVPAQCRAHHSRSAGAATRSRASSSFCGLLGSPRSPS